MPMTPAQKAKQTARQEAEWGHTRPEPSPVDNEHVAEPEVLTTIPVEGASGDAAETRVVYAVEGAIRSPEIDAALEASMAFVDLGTAEEDAVEVVLPEPPPVTNTVSKAATTARRKSAAKKK